jgi:hypothetical protein
MVWCLNVVKTVPPKGNPPGGKRWVRNGAEPDDHGEEDQAISARSVGVLRELQTLLLRTFGHGHLLRWGK